MKILIQSGTPIGKNDLYKPYFESLKRHAKRVARPDTIVDFPTLDRAIPGVARSRTGLHFLTHEALKSAVNAERQGYDAFVTQTLDYGYAEIRELIKIPVIYMAQATLAFYSQLAPTFAFIVNNERLTYYFQEMAERYKISNRMVPGGHVSVPFTDYANLWNHPEPFIENFTKSAREIVGRGAASLFPAGLYLSEWAIDQNIKEVDGALIMEPLTIAIKTAELMVDFKRMGIDRYQRGPWLAPTDEVRQIMLKELGI